VFLTLLADKEPEASLAQELSEALGCPLLDVQSQHAAYGYFLSARVERFARNSGLVRQAHLDLARLVEPLGRLSVLQLDVDLAHPSQDFSRCTGAGRASADSALVTHYTCHVDLRQPPPPLQLEYGYAPEGYVGFLALPFLLLVPVVLTLWARRSALRAASTDPAAAWFGYCRFEGHLALATWLGWGVVLALLDVPRLATFILPGDTVAERTLFRAGLFLLPPAAVVLLCNVLGHPVSVQMRGTTWTWSERLRQAFWGPALVWLPLLFGWAFIDALTHKSSAREVVLWIAAAVVGFLVALDGRNRAWNLKPRALTVGELRDRIFALAAKAGMQLSQIFLLPLAQSREANALINVKTRVVLLTDHLLHSLSKREVDAIVAHELGHLRKPSPGKILDGLLGVLVCLTWGSVFAAGMYATEFRWWSAVPLVSVLCLVVVSTWRSRRWERIADAEAVTLTGDAEALITALLAIAKLNGHPLRWSRWEEHVITHPSTLRRIEAIARQGGVSPERLQELLGQGNVAADRYELPAGVTRDDKVYSTAYKSRWLRRFSGLLLGVSLATPALAAWIVEAVRPSDWVRWVIYAAGLLATPALYLSLARLLGALSDRGLKRRLWARLAREGVHPENGVGVFVGFSPGDRPRIFEGFSDWDLGFLFVAGDRLCYVGEQTRFALVRGQIEAEFREARFPGWRRPVRTYVRWRDEQRGTSGVFNLRLADTLPAPPSGERTRTLGQYLRGWKEQLSASESLPGVLAGLGSPALGDVTGIAPGKLANSRSLLSGLWISLLLAAGVCVLVGLPFSPILTSGAWYVFLVVALNTLFQQFPYWRYRETLS
jgi:Zn-dependent protease with chaperone function